MRNLLDINLLIALLDTAHPGFGAAHEWASKAKDGFATCPLVQNGVFRIMTQPAYSAQHSRPPLAFATVLSSYKNTLLRIDHQQWDDSISLADDGRFDHSKIYGPRQLTDIYLLGLAVENAGRLVTFDRNIPLNAVRGAKAKNLVVL